MEILAKQQDLQKTEEVENIHTSFFCPN